MLWPSCTRRFCAEVCEKSTPRTYIESAERQISPTSIACCKLMPTTTTPSIMNNVGIATSANSSAAVPLSFLFSGRLFLALWFGDDPRMLFPLRRRTRGAYRQRFQTILRYGSQCQRTAGNRKPASSIEPVDRIDPVIRVSTNGNHNDVAVSIGPCSRHLRKTGRIVVGHGDEVGVGGVQESHGIRLHHCLYRSRLRTVCGSGGGRVLGLESDAIAAALARRVDECAFQENGQRQLNDGERQREKWHHDERHFDQGIAALPCAPALVVPVQLHYSRLQ